jgi:RecA-family ATPase
MPHHIADVLAQADEAPDLLCTPYLARRGITFLHGKTSIGKSPLTWELARTVSQGLDFLGHPTVKSTVLYLEADSAEPLLRPRLRLLPQPVGDWWVEFLLGEAKDLCNEGHSIYRKFATLQHSLNPDLVIWNTLRQFYTGTAIDSDTVTRVYNGMYRAFPNAGHLMVAHDRKGSLDPNAPTLEDEAFAGSAAWRDLATIALHLVPRGSKSGSYLTLEHTKSQVSELAEPLKLTLSKDGTLLTPHRHPLQDKVLAFLAHHGTTRWTSDLIKLAMTEFDTSRATLFRITSPKSN